MFKGGKIFNSGLEKIIFVCAVVSVLFWAVFLYALFADDKSNPEAIAYLFKERENIPDNDNAWYYVIGLGAPDEVSDLHGYGLRLVNESFKEESVPFGKPPKIARNRIKIEGDVSQVYCWIGVGAPGGQCASKEEAMQIISNNETLIARYQSLYQYSEWGGKGQFARGDLGLVDLNRLMLAHIRFLAIDGDEERAIKLWIDNADFWIRMASMPMTLLEKMIVIIINGTNIDALPLIIESSAKYEFDFQSILSEIKAISVDEWNIDDMLREEFGQIEAYACAGEAIGYNGFYKCVYRDFPRKSVLFKPNLIINRYHTYAMEYNDLFDISPSEFKKSCEEFRTRWAFQSNDFSWVNFFKYDEYMLSILMVTSPSLCSFIEGINRQNAKINLLKLYLHIKKDRISRENMEAYVKSAPAELQNPINGEPFYWDGEKNVIGFSYSVDDKYLDEITVNFEQN